MKYLLIGVALLAALAAGCGGGSTLTPISITNAFSVLSSAAGPTGSQVTSLQATMPAGQSNPPTLTSATVSAAADTDLPVDVSTTAPADHVLVGVQNATGYYQITLPAVGTRQSSLLFDYPIVVHIAPGVKVPSFNLTIRTVANGQVSGPAYVAVFVSSSAGTTGGATSGSGGWASQLPRTTTANWTVLVYINSANNLEPFSVENIDQMEQATYSSDVNVAVEWKRLHESALSDDYLFDPNIPEWDGTRRFWLHGGGDSGVSRDQIQDLGSGPVGSNPSTPDLGSWQHLHDFITWGQTNFPARHYLLVIWNHGAGWEHRAVISGPIPHRGLSYDDQSNDSIETWQLPQALSVTSPLDVVAMDCSLMQMLEVDYEMRNVATYIVGSEDSPPGDGYPYQLWLPPLTANPSMTPLALAKSISQTHGSFYLNNPDSSGALDAVTQSVVATAALPALATALSNLGNVLISDEPSFASQFGQARKACNQYAIEGGVTIYGEYKDLYQYCTLLEQDAPTAPGLSTAAEAVKTAITGAVLDNEAVRGDSFSHGISIYVPEPGAFDTSYGYLDLAQVTTWSRWLQAQTQ